MRSLLTELDREIIILPTFREPSRGVALRSGVPFLGLTILHELDPSVRLGPTLSYFRFPSAFKCVAAQIQRRGTEISVWTWNEKKKRQQAQKFKEHHCSRLISTHHRDLSSQTREGHSGSPHRRPTEAVNEPRICLVSCVSSSSQPAIPLALLSSYGRRTYSALRELS